MVKCPRPFPVWTMLAECRRMEVPCIDILELHLEMALARRLFHQPCCRVDAVPVSSIWLMSSTLHLHLAEHLFKVAF